MSDLRLCQHEPSCPSEHEHHVQKAYDAQRSSDALPSVAPDAVRCPVEGPLGRCSLVHDHTSPHEVTITWDGPSSAKRTNEAETLSPERRAKVVEGLGLADKLIKDHAAEIAHWKRRAIAAENALDAKDETEIAQRGPSGARVDKAEAGTLDELTIKLDSEWVLRFNSGPSGPWVGLGLDGPGVGTYLSAPLTTEQMHTLGKWFVAVNQSAIRTDYPHAATVLRELENFDNAVVQAEDAKDLYDMGRELVVKLRGMIGGGR